MSNPNSQSATKGHTKWSSTPSLLVLGHLPELHCASGNGTLAVGGCKLKCSIPRVILVFDFLISSFSNYYMKKKSHVNY